MNKIEQIRRYTWAILLLLLPMFAYPLAWFLPLGKMIPAWDLLQACTLPVIGLTALAAAASEPGRLIKAWQSSKLLKGFLSAGLLCVLAAGIQQILYGGLWENFYHSLFFIALPWAGIALAPELKRILPWWCMCLFFFLLWTTTQTPMCSGFSGNWNWNFSLLAISLAAVVILTFQVRGRLIIGGIAVSAGVFCVFVFFPELAPRGTLAGVIGAALALGIALLFKRQERWRYALLAALAGAVLFISAVNSPSSASLTNARVQLWRGSLDFALVHSLVGVGPARFESRIPPYIPPDYFLSDFPATRHPHPHNELLNMWAGFGLSGILYILMWAAAAARQIRRKDPVGLWMLWSFLLLFIHGLFDVLLATPLAGTLFFLMLGTICGSGLSGGIPRLSPGKRFAAAAVCMLLALLYLSWNIRSSTHLHKGRILLMQNRKTEALKQFRKSAEIYPTAPALYMAGQAEFFDFHRPEYGIFWWTMIHNELRMPSFLHLNRFLGHAYDVKSQYNLALYYFEKEARDFPFSALNAGLRLGTLQKSKASPEKITAAAKLLQNTLKMRKMNLSDFPRLLRTPALDDEPLVK